MSRHIIEDIHHYVAFLESVGYKISFHLQRELFTLYFHQLLKYDVHDHTVCDYLKQNPGAAGLILVSGMVHTEYTVAPIQFGAYGALIVAMIIQTALTQKQSDKPVLLWLSVAFLTAFSMAIPVMYRSNIAYAGLFHVLEAITALVLVAMFTGMLYQVFCKDATNLFYFVPMLTAVALDTVLIVMRWREEINWFVLVSLIATCVLFLIGRLWDRASSRNR